MTIPITDQSQYSQLLANMLFNQSQVNKLNVQFSTGQKSQDFAGISGDANTVISLESAQAKANTYIGVNNMVQTLGSASLTSLNSIISIAKGAVQMVNGVADPAHASIQVQQLASDMLNQVQGYLNETVNGQYLFAGSKNTVPPVNLASPPSPAPIDPNTGMPVFPDSSYYQGDQQAPRALIDDGQSVTYGVTADSLAIQKVVWALRTLATTPGTQNAGASGNIFTTPTTPVSVGGNLTLGGTFAGSPVTLAYVGGVTTPSALATTINGNATLQNAKISAVVNSKNQLVITGPNLNSLNDSGGGFFGTSQLNQASATQIYAAAVTQLDSALSAANTTSASLSGLTSLIGQAQSQSQASVTKQTNFNTYAGNVVTNLTKADTATTAASLSAAQTTLQASYSVIAKATTLSLLTYLK